MTWEELFSAGYCIGLQPREVLDLSLWEFNACVIGYQNKLIDLRTIAVVQGYYAAYYTNSKHAKPVSRIIDDMLKSKDRSVKQKHYADVNIDAIKCLDQIFKEAGIHGR